MASGNYMPRCPPETLTDVRAQINMRFARFATCMICKAKVKDPHLCPHCSKLFCFKCISERLNPESEESKKCPSCEAALKMDDIVKVRWFENMEGLIRDCLPPLQFTTKYSKKGTCIKHFQVLSFFCINCNVCICCICAASDKTHVDHTYQTLDKVYERHKKDLSTKYKEMDKNHAKIKLLGQQLGRYEELIKQIKEYKLKECQMINEYMIQSIEDQASVRLTKLEDHKTMLLLDTTQIGQTLERMELEVQRCSESQFMANKSYIFRTCDDILIRAIGDFDEYVDTARLKIETPDIYVSGAFILENFSKHGNLSKRSYSKHIRDGLGNTWRIMVWIQEAEDEMGVFLELVSGNACWVECDFILYHTNPEKIVRGYKNHYYDLGEMEFAGIYDFITMKKIKDDKYLRYDDSLSFMYHFRRSRQDVDDLV